MPNEPSLERSLTIRSADEARQRLRSRADFSYVQFDGLELNGLVARQSLFTGGVFRNCTLIDCDFSRCDFEGTRFEGCRIIRSSFEDADIRSSLFARCQFERCAFTGSYYAANVHTECEISSCAYDRGTLLDNRYVSCRLTGTNYQVSTVLHSDFRATTFSDVTLGNCTCLYSYFEDCRFEKFRINADAVGLSYGLDVRSLQGTKLIFLGREEDVTFEPGIVEDLIEEFRAKGWQLHASLADLNFGRVSAVDGWSQIFEFFLSQYRQGRIIRSDDVAFVLRVASRLADREVLPLYPVIQGHDHLAELGPMEEDDTRSVLYSGLAGLLARMQDRYLAATKDLQDIRGQDLIMAEFVFREKPALELAALLSDIRANVSPTAGEISLLGHRTGSWIEIVKTPAMIAFQLYAILYLIEGCLVRITMIRARLQHAFARRLPQTFINRALDPSLELKSDLLRALAAAYAGLGAKTIIPSAPEGGISGNNLQEIRVDKLST